MAQTGLGGKAGRKLAQSASARAEEIPSEKVDDALTEFPHSLDIAGNLSRRNLVALETSKGKEVFFQGALSAIFAGIGPASKRAPAESV